MSRTRPPYTKDFRKRMVVLARAGRSVSELAEEFEPSDQTIRSRLNHPRLKVEGFYGGCDDWKSAEAHSPTVKSESGGSRSWPSM
jgi:DeoR/GlpR family transcriptional regulator of sugar metabolism